MELFFYIAAFAVGLVAILKGQGKRSWIRLYLIIFFAYVISDRLGTYSPDLQKFSEWMTENWDISRPFVYKEILFFKIGYYLYLATGSTTVSIIILDFIAYSFAIAAFKKTQTSSNLPAMARNYSGIIIYMSSFMILLSSQNFYRQFLGMSFLSFGYSYAQSGSKFKSLFYNFIGVLFHNATVLGTPVLVMRSFFKGNRYAWIISLMLVIAGSVGLLYLFASGVIGSDFKKSNENTGANMTPAYIGVLLFLFLICLYCRKFRPLEAMIEAPAITLGIILTVTMSFLFNDAPAERVGLMFVILGLLDVTKSLNPLGRTKKKVIYAGLLVALFIPSVVFHNAFQFLTNTVHYGN